MKGMFKTLVLASLIVAIAAAGVVYSGAIYIGADQPHLAPVHTLFTLARERSIAVRAEGIRVPPLDDDALVRGAPATTTPCAWAVIWRPASRPPS